MTSSCRVLHLLFVVLILLVSRPEQQCLGLVPKPPDGDSNSECRPADIQLYTWSGSGFESGECWHQGHRFLNGATWGRTDVPGAPYCICEHGQVRVFYSQDDSETPPIADTLTILRPTHGSSPTPNDLAKWPIPNGLNPRQRTVICSANRLNVRVRSRDGCIGCKCSKNGHWLCRKPPTVKANRTINSRGRNNQRQRLASRNNNLYPYIDSSDSVNIQLRVTALRIRPQCPIGTIPQVCVLIERIQSTNITEKSSRYIEIARETSWTDRNACTRCVCTLDGRLTCEYLHDTCKRPCLIHKTRPISMIYYFPPGSKWLTPPNDQCRSCTCIDGQRKCVNCDQILKIDIESEPTLYFNERGSSIGEYSLLPTTMVKMKPCLLQIDPSSHRLILPGQQTWFEERCYFCSKRDGRLISC